MLAIFVHSQWSMPMLFLRRLDYFISRWDFRDES